MVGCVYMRECFLCVWCMYDLIQDKVGLCGKGTHERNTNDGGRRRHTDISWVWTATHNYDRNSIFSLITSCSCLVARLYAWCFCFCLVCWPHRLVILFWLFCYFVCFVCPSSHLLIYSCNYTYMCICVAYLRICFFVF